LREWTKEEIEKLKLDYSLKGIPELAEELGRSENAIRIKASRLGLKRTLDINPCFGQDFTESCVDNCEDWLACLDAYTKQIQDALEIIFSFFEGNQASPGEIKLGWYSQMRIIT